MFSPPFYMPFIEGISSAKTIPAKGATGVWESGGNFILKDPGNYIRQDSEQACSERKLDQTSYGIPFQFELFDDCATFIAIKCCTRTVCTQSPSDTDRQSPTASSALMHLSFPKKSICKLFHPFSSCLQSFIFPEHYYNLGYQQTTQNEKNLLTVCEKNSYQTSFSFLPSPCRVGTRSHSHMMHTQTQFSSRLKTPYWSFNNSVQSRCSWLCCAKCC